MLVSSVAEISLSFACLRHIGLQEDARPRQQLRRALARANQRFKLLALPGAQLHHLFLDRNLFPGHESSPPLPNRDRDSEKHTTFKDASD